jgi:hypothetical protein
MLKELRIAVLGLERISEAADRAARNAREKLTLLAMELEEDFGISEGDSVSCREPPQSQNSTLDLKSTPDGNER